ncbi:MAG: hypothetical protein PVH00_06780 [Gemmatimonadota bacterium]|jgi:hypothetical protein
MACVDSSSDAGAEVFFARSYRGGPDPHLRIKTAVFVVGAGLALAGMVYEMGWLISVAIALLAVALIGARIARARRDDDVDDDSADDEAGGP